MAKYSNSSPWSTTTQNSLYLELMQMRPVPAEADDALHVIQAPHRHSPDLLAYDIYGNPKLWWVFVQRNMSVLKDPIYDFETGVAIYIPKKSNLTHYLGV